MTALPSGTATFLFSDIEGSTRLVQSRQHRVNQHRAYEGGACAGAVRVHVHGSGVWGNRY
jgi:class 3 adenylate cyclase